jgi:hypothetical protein
MLYIYILIIIGVYMPDTKGYRSRDQQEQTLELLDSLTEGYWLFGNDNKNILNLLNDYISTYEGSSYLGMGKSAAKSVFAIVNTATDSYLDPLNWQANLTPEKLIAALSSKEGKQFLELNSNAILKIALDEMKPDSTSKSMLETINSISTYISGKGNSFLEARAASYISNRQALGLPDDKESFKAYMLREQREDGVEKYCEGLFKSKLAGFDESDKDKRMLMFAGALSAAEAFDGYLSVDEGRSTAKAETFMRTFNNYTNLNEIYSGGNKFLGIKEISLNEAEVIIKDIEIIQKSTTTSSNDVIILAEWDAKFEKYTSKTNLEDINKIIDSGTLASLIAGIDDSTLKEALPSLIKLVKNGSANGGLPPGIAFSKDASWTFSDKDAKAFHQNYMTKNNSILDRLGPIIPDIKLALGNSEPENKQVLKNLVEHITANRPDKMRFLYKDIIDLLKNNKELSCKLAKDGKPELLSELILGIVHASFVTNNVEENKLDILSYKVDGKPILQQLQPFLTEVLKVALSEQGSALKDPLSSLLTKLNVDEHDDSNVPALKKMGLTVGQIGELLAILPDPDVQSVELVNVQKVEGVSSMSQMLTVQTEAVKVEAVTDGLTKAIPVGQGVAEELEGKLRKFGIDLDEKGMSLLEAQKKFQKQISADMNKDLLNIFANGDLQANTKIGPEIKALDQVFSAISSGKIEDIARLASPFNTKAPINILSRSTSLPIAAFIKENRDKLEGLIKDSMGLGKKGATLSEFVVFPLLCLLDSGLATVARGVEPTALTKCNTVVLATLGIPVTVAAAVTAGVGMAVVAGGKGGAHSVRSFFKGLGNKLGLREKGSSEAQLHVATEKQLHVATPVPTATTSRELNSIPIAAAEIISNKGDPGSTGPIESPSVKPKIK